MGIYSTLILLILLGRAAFVFPLSTLSNYMNRKAERTPVITFKHQVSIAMITFMHSAREGSYTLSWPMDFKISIYVANHLVGRAYERGSLYCIGF